MTKQPATHCVCEVEDGKRVPRTYIHALNNDATNLDGNRHRPQFFPKNLAIVIAKIAGNIFGGNFCAVPKRNALEVPKRIPIEDAANLVYDLNHNRSGYVLVEGEREPVSNKARARRRKS